MLRSTGVLLITLLSIALPFTSLHAASPANPTHGFQPRITAEGWIGDHAVGSTDVLLPVTTHAPLEANQLFFLDGRGRIASNDSEEINLGLGYRHIFGQQPYILGAYAFYDGMASPQHHYFQAITAGVERLGRAWDGRINYYQPVGKKQFHLSHAYANPSTAGHFVTLDDEQSLEKSIPGYDVELGGLLTGDIHHPLKGFVSYYHFGWASDPKIDGERVRFEQALTPRATLLAVVQYDNQRHWQSYVGFRFSFGGTQSPHGSPVDRPINERLTDLVIRDSNIVTAHQNKTRHYPVPDRFLFVNNGVENNGDGTIEAPFSSLEKAVAVAKSSDVIVLKTGTRPYAIGKLTLHPHQHISGGHYSVQLPKGNARFSLFNQEPPTLVGRLNLMYGNELQNITIDANHTQRHGVYGNQGSFSRLVNLKVVNATQAGIRFHNGENIQMINTQAHDNGAQGILLTGVHHALLQDVQTNNNLGEGIHIKNSSPMTLLNSESRDNGKRGLHLHNSTGHGIGNRWIHNTREGIFSKGSTFNFKGDTLRDNSAGTTSYPQAYSRNHSLLTFYGVNTLHGKFKGAKEGQLVFHTRGAPIHIVNGTVTFSAE